MAHLHFRRLLLALVLTLSATLSAPAAPTATPAPEDLPRPVPGDIGLAGARCPDISRYLNVRSAVAPSPAPDGKRIAYRTSVTGQPQLWVSGGSGVSRQITFGESVTGAEWSPDGRWIAYAVDRGGNEREGYYLISPDGLSERELLAPAQAFRVWGGFSPDGSQVAYAATEEGGDDFNIYVLDVASGRSRRVYIGKGGVYVAAWKPDGNGLLLSRVRGEDANDLLYLDLTTGQARDLLAPAEASANLSPAWSRDGRGFYLATNQDRDTSALAYYDLGAGQLQILEAPAHEVEAVALSGEGRYLAWSENVNGFSRLRVRDLVTGRTETPAGLPAGVIGTLEWARRAPRLAVSLSGPRVSGDIWLYDAATRKLARSTESATAGLAPERFVEPQAVSFPSHDGLTIHGLWYRPPTPAGAKLPAVLLVHGGPTGQARPDFDGVTQYLLARGYAVLDLNFRGSTGYGKRFARLDNGRLRPNAVKDMAAAADWLKGQGVGPVAVMGGSYGGYLTFAALTTLSDRFQAGVGFVGVSNWLTALAGASPTLKASDRYEYGNIDDPADREFFKDLSPITHVASVRAPLMVLHGANDPRDPVGEADQLVSAIRGRNGDVEYLRFPDEGHGIRKLSNRVTAYRRIARFLERTLGPGATDCTAQ